MQLSDNEISILLLCTDVGLGKGGAAPLTQAEWTGVYNALISSGLEPQDILHDSSGNNLRTLGYDDEFILRVKMLMDRSMQMSLGLETLSKDGINLITIMDARYPLLFRKKLKDKTPPVLYYIGDISHANKIGIGIVGSRNVSDEGADFARRLAKQAAKEKLVVYSGGARGVDSISEYATLSSGGIAVEYVADSMYKKMKSSDATRAIMDNRLLMISDMNPRVGFIAWRAMNRNKYIYISSYGTFVVDSDYKKGGTWTGAKEALSKGYSKVFVRVNDNSQGNSELIRLGGIAYPEVRDGLKDEIMKAGTVDDSGSSNGSAGLGSSSNSDGSAGTGSSSNSDGSAGTDSSSNPDSSVGTDSSNNINYSDGLGKTNGSGIVQNTQMSIFDYKD